MHKHSLQWTIIIMATFLFPVLYSRLRPLPCQSYFSDRKNKNCNLYCMHYDELKAPLIVTRIFTIFQCQSNQMLLPAHSVGIMDVRKRPQLGVCLKCYYAGLIGSSVAQLFSSRDVIY